MTRRLVFTATLVAASVLLTGCIGGTPSPRETDGQPKPTWEPPAEPEPKALDEINAEFAERVEPEWEIDVPDIFGQPAVGDGFAAVYSRAESGLRLAVYSTKDGELLWERAASPGGAFSLPLFAEYSSSARGNAIPAIEPIVVTQGEGEDARELILYYEREDSGDILITEDSIHAVDAKTGEETAITVPGYDHKTDWRHSVRVEEDGTVILDAVGPPRECGPDLCFEDSLGGYTTLDVRTMEASYVAPFLDAADSTRLPEWGPGFVRVLTQDVGIAHYADGAESWARAADELFGDPRTDPASSLDFIQTRGGESVIVQGYQSLLSDPEQGTLQLDFTTSRTAVSLNRDTGKTEWIIEGGDAYCYAVDDFERQLDDDVIPMCLATGGSFTYDKAADETDGEDPVASIVGVNVEDGSIAWEVEHAGELSVAVSGRLLSTDFASRGDIAMTQIDDDEPGVLDLTSGEWLDSPKGSTFVCQREREDVEIEFAEIFDSGGNPISTGYPGGWEYFPCDVEGGGADWSLGAVRVAGFGVEDGVSVLPTVRGLVGFTLP